MAVLTEGGFAVLFLNEPERTKSGALHSAHRGILIAIVVCVLVEVLRAGPFWGVALIFGVPLAAIVALVVRRLARNLADQNRLSMGRAIVWGALIYGSFSILAAIYGVLFSGVVTLRQNGATLFDNGVMTSAGYVEFFVFRPVVQSLIGAAAALAGWLAAFGTIMRVNIVDE
jgi:hypothetical protein